MNLSRKILFFAILVAAHLFGQTFNLNGNGARGAGMGYAFTGIADDATAIAWNPAGLVHLQSPEIFIIGRLGFGSAEKTYDPYTGFAWEDDFIFSVDSYNIDVGSNLNLNFISLAYPFRLWNYEIVAGLAYRNLYDFSKEQSETASGEVLDYYTQAPLGRGRYEADYSSSGGVNAISPAIGVKVNEIVYIGTTINLLNGNFDQNLRRKFYINDSLAGMEELEFDEKESYSGFSVELGILIKPVESISIGATLGLPHTLKIKDNVNNKEFSIEVPLFYSFGIGIQATDQLLVAFDYHSRPWSKAKVEIPDAFRPLDFDINSIHMGLEYVVLSGQSVLPVRLGFYTQPTLDKDARGEQIKNYILTTGFGLVINRFIFDVAFEWGHVEYLATKFTSGQEINYTGNHFLVTLGATIHLGK